MSKQRQRKVDVKKLTSEQVEKLQEQIGKELSKIFDEAGSKANQLLNIYGLQVQIGYEIKEVSENTDKKEDSETSTEL